MEEEVYKIEDLETRYPDEWVAVEVVERNEDGLPVLVKLLVHDSDHDKVYDRIQHLSSITIFFTGEIFPEGRGYVL